MREINDKDVIFIKKTGKEYTPQELSELALSSYWGRDGKLRLDWYDDMNFDNSEIRIISSVKSKLCYLFASMYEDTMLKNLVQELIPGVKSIELSNFRYAFGKNMSYWMDKYHFTLKDFLLQDRYIIVSQYARECDTLTDLGLIDWDNIEYCSLLEDD